MIDSIFGAPILKCKMPGHKDIKSKFTVIASVHEEKVPKKLIHLKVIEDICGMQLSRNISFITLMDGILTA